MQGEEIFIDKAVECSVQIATSTPWSTTGTKTVLRPGRIKSILGKDTSRALYCYVVLFEEGNIILSSLESLCVIPEIKEDDVHYVISKNIKYYIKDDYLHREDGPAVEHLKENKSGKYYLHGVEYKAEEYLDALPEEKQGEMLFHLNDLRKSN